MLARPSSAGRRGAVIALAFIAFISLGLPDGLLGVAWPFMRTDFAQPVESLGLLVIAMTSGYLISSFLSGLLVRRFGVGLLLAGSVLATACALFGFTLAPLWLTMILSSALLGIGSGAIDAGLNNYVAQHHSDGLMQWLHASFGVGVTLGPVIMSAGLGLTDSWRTGYLVVGSFQLVLALAFLLTAGLWAASGAAEPSRESPDSGHLATFSESLRLPAAWLGVMLFVLYSGMELTLGLWGFTLLTEARGVNAETAALWISVYWGMFTIGRVTAGVFTRRLGIRRVLHGSLILAVLAPVLLWWQPTPLLGLLGLALSGFAYAPVFPAMLSSTRHRLPARHITNVMGMQIAGAGVGTALMPALAGWLAAQISLEVIPVYAAAAAVLVLLLYRASGSDRSDLEA